MVGVEIAVSLIPPASVIGIGLALNDLQVSQNALVLLVVNILAIDFLGSMMIFVLRGLRKDFFDLERDIRKLVNNVDDMVVDNRGGIDNIIADLEATARNFKEFSEDIKHHPWKLLMKGKEKKAEDKKTSETRDRRRRR